MNLGRIAKVVLMVIQIARQLAVIKVLGRAEDALLLTVPIKEDAACVILGRIAKVVLMVIQTARQLAVVKGLGRVEDALLLTVPIKEDAACVILGRIAKLVLMVIQTAQQLAVQEVLVLSVCAQNQQVLIQDAVAHVFHNKKSICVTNEWPL